MNSILRILLPLLLVSASLLQAADSLALRARKQIPYPNSPDQWQVIEQDQTIDPRKTAIIICDMWDKHWCRSATARVGEIAPRMNDLIKAARAKGVLIIHAPSDTMDFYKDFPQRKKAMSAPKSEAPAEIGKWRALNQEKEGPLPIDDSDGGCDDFPQCANFKAWKKQIDVLEIAAEDYITDKGDEVYNILQQHGIENVVILGVHTNMCVLGRPFSIRQMVSLGKNTFLVRDMTDTMYNPRKRPFVSHFAGTDLVVSHIERHWCPSITSVAFLGGEPFRFHHDRRKTVAFVIGENEYRTWETLPAFAERELKPHSYRVELVSSSTNVSDANFHNVNAIKSADLLVISARRRSAPKEMLQSIRDHLAAGKPLIGIRTASHAFAPRGRDRENLKNPAFAEWPEFDNEVLGGSYSNHYGRGPNLKIEAAPQGRDHPILKGVDLSKIDSQGSLYIVSPLKPDATPLLIGEVPSKPAEPVAWARFYGPNKARVFYTSFGHPEDFKNEPFRKMIINAIAWGLGEELKGN